jgi:hypothetical protein
MKISHSASSSGTAAFLKSSFSNLGFQNITDEVLEVSIPEKSSIIFSPSIPTDVRNTIIVEIGKTLSGASVLENQDSGFTVTILIGKT